MKWRSAATVFLVLLFLTLGVGPASTQTPPSVPCDGYCPKLPPPPPPPGVGGPILEPQPPTLPSPSGTASQECHQALEAATLACAFAPVGDGICAEDTEWVIEACYMTS